MLQAAAAAVAGMHLNDDIATTNTHATSKAQLLKRSDASKHYARDAPATAAAATAAAAEHSSRVPLSPAAQLKVV